MRPRVALAVVVIIGTSLTACGGSPSTVRHAPTRLEPRFRLRFLDIVEHGAKPSPSALPLTARAAQERLGQPLLVPDARPASSACLRVVWVDSLSAGHLIEVFSTSIAVYLDYGAPEEDYSAEAEAPSMRLLASIGQVHEAEALLIRSRGRGGLNPGSVSFRRRDVNVSVYGYFPTSDLLEVAESIGPLGRMNDVPCSTPSGGNAP